MATNRTLRILLLVAAASCAVADYGLQRPIGATSSGRLTAKLVLYPGSRVHPEDLKSLHKEVRPCPENSESAEIDLQVDTCISGEYYAQENLKFTALPSCDDGTTPTLSFYRRRGCAGKPSLTKAARGLLNSCLWSEEDEPNPSYYWSMVLSCSATESPAIAEHQAAEPAITHQITGGVKGNVIYDDTGRCGQDGYINPMSRSTALDSCSWPITRWKFTSIQIENPPICPNGTRARLARLEDTGEDDRTYLKGMCNGGKITFVDGLVDINDDDIGECIGVRDMALTRGGKANAKGIMWYCDGLDPTGSKGGAKEVETTSAIVSHNVCKVSAWRRPKETPRPTTWMEIPIDTCVDLHNSQPLRLLKDAVCADGSKPLMATWRSLGCQGMPDQVGGVTARLGLQCKTFHGGSGEASYSFWCDKEGSRGLSRPKGDRRAVYSRDACKPKNGMWSPERHAGLAATVARTEADTCIDYFSRDSQWVVHGGAVCADGKPARMAVWNGKTGCRGEPDSVEEIREDDLGKCVEACGSSDNWTYKCSRAFWCEGLPQSKGGRKGRW